MVSDDSRTYNDPRDPRYRAYEEARREQAAQAQRRAREQARLQAERKKQEWREEAERAQRQRRQRAQQQLQDQPWRSKFADLPQSPEEVQERHQVYEQTQRLHQQRAREQRAQHQRELLERQQSNYRAPRQNRRAEAPYDSEQTIRGKYAQTPQAQVEDRRRRAAQEAAVQRSSQQAAAQKQAAAQRQQAQQPKQPQAQQRQDEVYSSRNQTVQQRQAAQRHAQQQAQPQVSAQEAARKEREALEQQYLQKMARQRAQEQAAQQAAQQQPAQAVHAQDASQYSRDAYGSGAKQEVSESDFYDPSDYDPSTYAAGAKRASSTSRSRNLRSGEDGGNVPSKKLIAIIVAIFVVVAILFVVNPLGCGNESASAQKSSTTATTASKNLKPSLPTPIMAESAGLELHSAVPMEFLTEVLIHNASYGYANEITTQLTEATNTEIIAAHGTGRVASEQPTGDKWMTGEFIRCFRSGNAGPTMSAIDCGGAAGTKVYAPVSGTVVLVKEYKLYNEIDDYRIHIQPEGRPDLDVVLIHLSDVTVKAGDKVVAGETALASIRDVEQYLGDSMQLKQYTASSDMGNHTHIQVNNANDPEYHGLDDLKPEANANAGDAQIAS